MTRLTKDEWLAARQQGITSTDVAAIAGLTPYKKPIDVWLDKQGLVYEDIENKMPVKIGLALEPVIAQMYTAETGVRLRRVGPYGNLRRHEKHEWAMATPDRFAIKQFGAFPVELKTAGWRVAQQFGEQGSDEIPESYMIQVQWQMYVCGSDRCDLAAILGGQPLDFRTYVIEQDRELTELLVEMAHEFFTKYVITGEQPPVDASDSWKDYINYKHPTAKEEPAEATPEQDQLARLLIASRDILGQAEEKVDTLTNEMKLEIGDHEAMHGNGWKISWKNTKDREKINYNTLIEELNVPKNLIDKHTVTTPGSRRFLLTKGEGNDTK
jgi:putative phage-type endonuclease